MCKILFVFKRFRVQNFVSIRRVEIFILNFSRCLVLLALAYIAQKLANKKLLWPGWRQTHACTCNLTLRIHFWPFQGHTMQTSHCFDGFQSYLILIISLVKFGTQFSLIGCYVLILLNKQSIYLNNPTELRSQVGSSMWYFRTDRVQFLRYQCNLVIMIFSVHNINTEKIMITKLHWYTEGTGLSSEISHTRTDLTA
jgi:hypothetical protein